MGVVVENPCSRGAQRLNRATQLVNLNSAHSLTLPWSPIREQGHPHTQLFLSLLSAFAVVLVSETPNEMGCASVDSNPHVQRLVPTLHHSSDEYS
ncbi:hypothetical protein B9Q01_09595, partial [Candidatus Marsarchaeota G1 archaeon OSP_D]